MLSFVFEYLIRDAADHGWPPVHATRLSEVLVPPGGGWRVVEGRGDLVIEQSSLRVEFTGEMVGWHVAFHGSEDEDLARNAVDLVAAQIGAEVGRPVEVMEI